MRHHVAKMSELFHGADTSRDGKLDLEAKILVVRVQGYVGVIGFGSFGFRGLGSGRPWSGFLCEGFSRQ